MNKSVEKVWLLALFAIPMASANDKNGLVIANNNILAKNSLIASNKIVGLSTIASADDRYGNISIVSTNSQGYASYFELNEKVIDVSIAGLRNSPIALKGGLSFFKAKIDDSERNKLSNYLVDAGIKKANVKEILDTLTRGVDGSRECKGKKSECVILSSELAAVVDYYNNSLRLFVPSDMFETDDQALYLDTRSDSMLVSGMYATVNKGKEFSYFVRSNNVLGLGDGYVNADGSANKSHYNVDQLNFNLDHKDFTATAGLISNTSRLGVAGYEALFNQPYYGAEISNHKFLKIKNFASKGIDFFSPSDGVLTVYNSSDEVLYQANIRSGMNSIPYALLPYGSYAVRYEVKKNDNIVLKGDNFVTNTDSFDASESSYYVRFGAVKNTIGEDTAPILLDVGASLPVFNQQSITGNATIIEGEAFLSVGYYANIGDLTASAKYSMSNRANQFDASIYGGSLSLSLSDTNVSDESFLGDEDSFSATLGTSHYFNSFNLTLSATYGENGNDSYLSYNANAYYSFESGVSLYASYNGTDDDDRFGLGVSIPFFDNATYSGTANVYEGSTDFINSVTNSMEINDELSLLGSVSHKVTTDSGNNIEANATSLYSNDAFSGSAGVKLYNNGYIGYSGSLNTTAFVTTNNVYFKSSMIGKTSAIEVNQVGESLNGEIKVKDKVSGYNTARHVDGSTLIDLKPYTMAAMDYEFDNDSHALKQINIDNNQVVSLLPGKIHYVDVDQQPVGNVLIVSSGFDESDIICSGEACVIEASVNDRVTKFKVKPNEHVSISRNGVTCFDGYVEYGQTKMGVCK